MLDPTSRWLNNRFNYRESKPNPALGSLSGGGQGVITLSHAQHDIASNLIAQHTLEATDNAASGIALSATDTYVSSTVYHWYDDVDRRTATASYGSGSGVASTWKYTTLPGRSIGPPPAGTTAWSRCTGTISSPIRPPAAAGTR